MKQIHTQIEIDSPVSVVWRILTDLPGYANWNSFIPMAEGSLAAGAVLRIKIAPPGQRVQDYRVTVLELEEERRFRWLGHFHVPGLIDGDHAFELESIGPRKTLLVQRERFKGLLVPFTWGSFLNTHLRQGFEALNRGLKDVAERSSENRQTQGGRAGDIQV